jgi:hypothetical protein
MAMLHDNLPTQTSSSRDDQGNNESRNEDSGKSLEESVKRLARGTRTSLHLDRSFFCLEADSCSSCLDFDEWCSANGIMI